MSSYLVGISFGLLLSAMVLAPTWYLLTPGDATRDKSPGTDAVFAVTIVLAVLSGAVGALV